MIFVPMTMLKCLFFSCANENRYDVVVIGGGIVGVATARELLIQHPTFRMAIVEKESDLAFHQSGNNSGVIHAGIYYKPSSLKAKLCVEGLHLMYSYLENKKIPYKKVGKLIVATRPAELPALHDLMKRGIANKVPDLKMIDGSDIPHIEPHCKVILFIFYYLHKILLKANSSYFLYW